MEKIRFDGDYAFIGDKKLDDENFTYISKGWWYIKGEKCKLEANIGWMGGLFRGLHICEVGNGEVENCGYKVGDIREDGELCQWDEFDIYDFNGTLLVEGENED